MGCVVSATYVVLNSTLFDSTHSCICSKYVKVFNCTVKWITIHLHYIHHSAMPSSCRSNTYNRPQTEGLWHSRFYSCSHQNQYDSTLQPLLGRIHTDLPFSFQPCTAHRVTDRVPVALNRSTTWCNLRCRVQYQIDSQWHCCCLLRCTPNR